MPKKRMNGEGSYRKRPNGTWEWQVMIGRRADGKIKKKSIYARTLKELKEKVRQYQQDVENNRVIDRRMSFSAWADIWYESMAGQVTETTYEGYAYSVKILKEYFGDMPLEDIKAMQVEKFLKDMVEQNRSDNYIKKLRAMLSQILKKAEANDLIIRNPVAVADPIKSKTPPKKEVKDSFTMEEVKLLMEHLPQNRIGWSIRLMLGTGMRTQELMGLEPKHIEPDGSVVHVQQAVTMTHGAPKIGPPKSKSSYRDIPVPETLWDTAKALRDTDEKYIWHGKKKALCNPDTFREQFAEEITKIPGVRKLTPHCCRHTYISQMQAAGVDIQTIQSIAGHADINMTEHYLHVQKEVQRSAVEKFNDMIFA